MKKYDEALREYRAAQTIVRDWVPTVAGMGNIYGITGQKAEAEKTLNTLHQMSSKKYVTPYGVALVYAGFGETDKVFEYLEKAYDDRSNWLIWLNLDPRWGSVRSDKSFIALIRKVGFRLKECRYQIRNVRSNYLLTKSEMIMLLKETNSFLGITEKD